VRRRETSSYTADVLVVFLSSFRFFIKLDVLFPPLPCRSRSTSLEKIYFKSKTLPHDRHVEERTWDLSHLELFVRKMDWGDGGGDNEGVVAAHYKG
jgi:hypothetical protein